MGRGFDIVLMPKYVFGCGEGMHAGAVGELRRFEISIADSRVRFKIFRLGPKDGKTRRLV